MLNAYLHRISVFIIENIFAFPIVVDVYRYSGYNKQAKKCNDNFMKGRPRLRNINLGV